MADFLDKFSDSELSDFSDQFYTRLNAAPGDYAATAAQATDLSTKKGAFAVNLTAHVAAQADARSKTQAKDASREQLEEIIRFIVKQAKLNGVDDSHLSKLGVPTGASGDAASNATRPTGSVDTSQRFQHLIRFSDEAAPDSKRKPRGVLGCEIYRKIDGAPPVDESECTFLTLDTESPYLADYSGTKAGDMIHYMLRWRMRDGSVSAWSETLSATVTG